MMKDITTKCQVFFALPELGKSLDIHKEYKKSITSGKLITKFLCLSLPISEMKNTKKQLSSVMCKFLLTYISFDVAIDIPKQEQMQLMPPIMSNVSVNRISLTLKGTFELTHMIGGNIGGCTISRGTSFSLVPRTKYMYETRRKQLCLHSNIRNDPLGVAL